MAAGANHSLLIKNDGSLWGVGKLSNGRLGLGNLSDTSIFRPQRIVDRGVVAVAAGNAHSLFIQEDGSLWAMGLNQNGQLGDGTFIERTTPVQIVANGVIAVAAGAFHSIFIKSDGSLWAMGNNSNGQLGNGTFTQSNIPVAVVGSGTSGVATVVAGQSHTLFLKTDGSAWSMGNNSFGQLGDSTSTSKSTPVAIGGTGFGGVSMIAAGTYHSILTKIDGSVWAFGLNNYGQLGDGSKLTRTAPVQVMANSAPEDRVSALCAGYYYSMMLQSNGTRLIMGLNSDGLINNGSSGSILTPTSCNDGQWSQLSSMGESIGETQLLLRPNGDLYGLGLNNWGELGEHGIVFNPQVVLDLPVTRVASDSTLTLVGLPDGSAIGMGINLYGELGDGTLSDSSRTDPRPMLHGDTVLLAGGGSSGFGIGSFSLFTKIDDSLWAVGYNGYGQLGDSSTINRTGLCS